MTDSLDSLFALIYGRPITADERNRLKLAGAGETKTPHAAMRRIIGAFDRQRLNTPLRLLFDAGDIEIVQFDGFQLAIDTADASVGKPILKNRSYEPHVTAFMRNRLKPGMNVVDVGANIGFFTALAASLVGDKGSVTAFEPNSENARLILLNVEINRFATVRLMPLALSNEAGCAYFAPHLGSNGGFLPSRSDILKSSRCLVVPTFRMDQLPLRRVDLMKLDVEGAEGLVVEGGWSTITKDRPVVVSEYSPEMLKRVSGVSAGDYLGRFLGIGYRIFVLERDKADGAGAEVQDVGKFLRSYGEETRIEDLAFLPAGALA